MINKVIVPALIIGMLFIWIWNWALMRIVLRHERQILDLKISFAETVCPEERRCATCQDKKTCPAVDTGVIYPYEHYKPTWRNENGQEH